MKKTALIITCLLFALAACKPALKPESLYGKWKYIRVEHPSSPSDSTSRAELEEQAPYIVFGKDNTVKIIWGGKELTHGTFTVSGQNIMVKEQLPAGKTRDFGFFTSALTADKIIFETIGEDGSRVTAIKLK